MPELRMRGIMIETTVNYTREYQGWLDLVEHVPMRVCQKTGNEFFAPETVAHSGIDPPRRYASAGNRNAGTSLSLSLSMWELASMACNFGKGRRVGEGLWLRKTQARSATGDAECC